MCKQKGRTFCSELGMDVSLWSTTAPLSKPEWINKEYQDFSESLNFLKEGNLDGAKSKLANSADQKMRLWFHEHAQNSGVWRHKTFRIPAPLPLLPLDKNKNFKKYEEEIFARDNLKCGYCSSKLFPKRVFKEFQASLGPELFPLGKTNESRSGFYLMFVATLDHVLPWSVGGRTDESNLITSCWSCNYGKANFTVEQLGISNPLAHPQ